MMNQDLKTIIESSELKSEVLESKLTDFFKIATLGAGLVGGNIDAEAKNPKHQSSVSSQTKGFNNNNPGNIEANKTSWVGATGSDGRFLKFVDMPHGVRAMAKVLKTYNKKYNLDTISGIIKRWAPLSDKNPTPAYIKFVSEHSGIAPTSKLDLNDPTQMYKIVDAIIRFENGKPVPKEDLTKGIQLALK